MDDARGVSAEAGPMPSDEEGADDAPFDATQAGMAGPGDDGGFTGEEPSPARAGQAGDDDDDAPEDDEGDPGWVNADTRVDAGDGQDPVERLRGLVTYLATNLVDEPDEVAVTVEQRGAAVHVQVQVAPDDLGKVIGRQGRVARAMRTTLMIAGSRDNLRTSLAIEE